MLGEENENADMLGKRVMSPAKLCALQASAPGQRRRRNVWERDFPAQMADHIGDASMESVAARMMKVHV